MRATLSALALQACLHLVSSATLQVNFSNLTELVNPSLLVPLKRNHEVTVKINGTTQELLDPSLLTPKKRMAEARTLSGQCGCGYSNTNPAASGRIVGGQEVNPMHSKPYQVYLQSCSSRGCAMCGATLLNKRYAMTAMHCVEEASSLVVALGEHNIRADIENHQAKTIQVERVIKRSDYDTNSVNNDIALLRLAEDVDLTSTIVPACLPSTNSQEYTGWQALVSGWGTTSSGGATSDVLKETSQTILANTAAECVQPRVPEDQEALLLCPELSCAHTRKGRTAAKATVVGLLWSWRTVDGRLLALSPMALVVQHLDLQASMPESQITSAGSS